MTPEARLSDEVLKALSNGATRLFRNTCALGWVGEFAGMEGNAVILRNPRRNQFGLVPGSGDLVGWTIRGGVAVFASIELKSPRGGKRGPEQIRWDEAVRAAGGVSGFAKTVEEARAILGL